MKGNWNGFFMCLEAYLEKGSISREETVELIRARKVFPCYFGSALKVEGVEEFLQGLDKYTGSSVYPEEFGAKIYKISRDAQGNRLTHMKITGGVLKVKMQLSGSREEKADQIRIYSGASFRSVKEVPAGTICAVTGLDIQMPVNYYPDNDPDQKPELIWRSHANNIYTNWLNYYVYQTTPYDLEGTPF